MIEVIKIPIQSATKKPYIVQGDTIPEWTIEFEVSDGVDLTNATIKMQIYWSHKKKIDLSVGNGITINSALKCTIDERDKGEVILPQGIGKGDLEILNPEGVLLTYFRIEYDIQKQYTI